VRYVNQGASGPRREDDSLSALQHAAPGAGFFVQRFGGALNLNVHFHMLVIDGAYRRSADRRTLRFHAAPPPTDEELARVLSRVVRGIARVIERRGLGDCP